MQLCKFHLSGALNWQSQVHLLWTCKLRSQVVCAFSQELILSFHLQDSIITLVNIKPKVKTQFRVTAEWVSPMVINPSGYSGVFFKKKKKIPSVCLLENLHRGSSNTCYGLDLNAGACTMTGLKPRAQSTLVAAWPAPSLLPELWKLEIDQDPTHLFPVCKGTACPPWQEPNPPADPGGWPRFPTSLPSILPPAPRLRELWWWSNGWVHAPSQV